MYNSLTCFNLERNELRSQNAFLALLVRYSISAIASALSGHKTIARRPFGLFSNADIGQKLIS